MNGALRAQLPPWAACPCLKGTVLHTNPNDSRGCVIAQTAGTALVRRGYSCPLVWCGMVWDCSAQGTVRCAAVRDGMGWDGMGWDGMGWDGMGWDGMGWDGMGWDGMGWDVLFCFVL